MTDTHVINGHGLAEDLKVYLVHLLDHAAHLLPTQGPIGVFVHHNTLHAFQHKMFDEAVAEASKLYGRQPYLTEAVFRAELKRGRILPADVEAILEREEDEEILPNRLSRRQLRRLLLVPGLREFDARTLPWLLDDALGSQASPSTNATSL